MELLWTFVFRLRCDRLRIPPGVVWTPLWGPRLLRRLLPFDVILPRFSLFFPSPERNEFFHPSPSLS